MVAEKFEAMINLGDLNSRMKDFYDIWSMMKQFDFEGGALAQAIQKTFKHRNTTLPKAVPFFSSAIYDKNSVNSMRWKSFLSTTQINNAPADLVVTAKSIESFLLGPVNAISDGRDFIAHWNAPGPWH